VRKQQLAGDIITGLCKMGYVWEGSATVAVESGGDNWFQGEDVAQQHKTAMAIFDASHPGCDGAFIFDNAAGHAAFAEDALLVTRMRLSPSAHADCTKMRATTWTDRDGKTHAQTLVREGKNIGVYSALAERGLWPSDAKLPTRGNLSKEDAKRHQSINKAEKETRVHTFKHRCATDKGVKGGSVCLPDGSCCASALLAAQPDFRAQKCRLREVTDEYNKEHGTHHTIHFLPKYHPELNPIERYWASLKAFLRKNTAWTAEGLRKLLPRALSAKAGHEAEGGGVPPQQFGRYFRKSGRIASAYRLGCSFALASFAATKFKSHRGIPNDETFKKMGLELAGKLGREFVDLGPPRLLPPPPLPSPKPKVSKKRQLSIKKKVGPPKKKTKRARKSKKAASESEASDADTGSESEDLSLYDGSDDEPANSLAGPAGNCEEFMSFGQLGELFLRELKAVAEHFVEESFEEVANTKASYASVLSAQRIPTAQCKAFVLEFRAKWELAKKKAVSKKRKATAPSTDPASQAAEEASASKNHLQIKFYKEALAEAKLDSCNELWLKAGLRAGRELPAKRARTTRLIIDGLSSVLR